VRRAISVTAASVVMAALLLGTTLTYVTIRGSSDALVLAEVRLERLEHASLAFELTSRAAVLSYLDSFAASLGVVVPSDRLSDELRFGAEKSLASLAFGPPSDISISVGSIEVAANGGAEGTLILEAKLSYSLLDASGDSLNRTYKFEIDHPMKLLACSSLVSELHEATRRKVLSIVDPSLPALARFNQTVVDQATGIGVTFVVVAQETGSLKLETSASDSGRLVAFDSSYSYVVRLESTLPVNWHQ